MIFDNILNVFVKYLIVESVGESLLFINYEILFFKVNGNKLLGWFCLLIYLKRYNIVWYIGF